MIGRRRRHFIKAIAAVSGLLVIVVLVQLGAEHNIVPSWEVLITRPISSWTKALDSENAEKEVEVTSITPAPSVREPTTPFRAANNPVSERSDGRTAQAEKADAPGKSTSRQSHVTNERLESSLVAMERQTPEPSDTAATPSEEKADEAHNQTNNHADRKMAEEELAKIIAAGGEKVREGVELPCLIAVWELDDLQKLASEGYGFIVVKWRGQLFRVISKGGSFLNADEFVPLIKETKDMMSNRGIDLNRKTQGKSYKDTPIRPALKALEERFVSRNGAGAKGEIPVFTFFPSMSFEAYLSRKQMGALASMGFDMQDPKWGKKTVATIGTIALTARRPVYVIDAVQVGSETHRWKDPERMLLSQRS